MRTKQARGNPACADAAVLTEGGEPTITRTRTGHLQLRQTPPGRITPEAEQTYLTALAAGANDRTAAAQAGFTHPGFHARANASPAFAREMEIARRIGRDRRLWEAMQRSRRRAADYELAVLPIPKTTAEEAILQLLHHRRSIQLGFPAPSRRYIPKTLAEVAPGIRAKLDAIRRGMHYEKTGSWRLPGEEATEEPPRRPRAQLVEPVPHGARLSRQ